MSDYWRDRELKHIEKMIKDDSKLAKRIHENQIRAMNEIQQQIDAFYGKYAITEGIAMAEARKRVSKLDIDTYSKKAKRYVRGAHSGDPMVKGLSFTKRANEEMRLYNLTMKVNRLELLKANINLELVSMTNVDEHFLLDAFTKGARGEYLRQAGILGESIAFNERNIATIVNSSFLNATWSERLWDNQDALRSEIERLLNRGIVQGQNPKVLARELRKKFDTSIDNSERLLVTEMARVQADVFVDSVDRSGYDSYEFIAESTACPICAALDGKVFKLKDAKIGVNMYPIHPWCHCSASAHMDREAWERRMDERGLVTDDLNKDEEHAINQYISSDSYKINEKLRKQIALNNDDKKMLRDLDNALRRMPKYEGDLTRSLYFNDEDGVNSFLKDHQVTNVVEYQSYTSTTKGDMYNPNSQVELYILDSKKGRDISKFNQGEQEILYERKNKFLVKGIEKIQGKYHIWMEEYNE